MQDSVNPRNLRDKYADWVGKKVVVGLTSFHYLCGTWEAVEGHEAIFRVGAAEKRIRLQEIDNVSQASDAQAQFYK